MAAAIISECMPVWFASACAGAVNSESIISKEVKTRSMMRNYTFCRLDANHRAVVVTPGRKLRLWLSKDGN